MNFNIHRKMRAKDNVDFQSNLPFSFGENLELTDLTKMKDNNERSRTPLSFINFLNPFAYRWDLELSGPTILCFRSSKKNYPLTFLVFANRVRCLETRNWIGAGLLQERTLEDALLAFFFYLKVSSYVRHADIRDRNVMGLAGIALDM